MSDVLCISSFSAHHHKFTFSSMHRFRPAPMNPNKPSQQASRQQGTNSTSSQLERELIERDNHLLTTLLQNSAGLQNQADSSLSHRSMLLSSTSGRLPSLASTQTAEQLLGQRVSPLIQQLNPYGFPPSELGLSQGLNQTSSQQAQPNQQQYPQLQPNLRILSNSTLQNRAVMPLSDYGHPIFDGVEDVLVQKYQVVSLSEKEKKGGFSLPAIRGPAKRPIIKSLAKYHRTWHRLTEKAASSNKINAASFVPEFFARSIARDKNIDHLYRKMHRLPSLNEIAPPLPTKRARYS
jgi:hypothetical protein